MAAPPRPVRREVEESLELAAGSTRALASSVSRSSRLRSDDRPEGSPIIPVPPPTSATGRPPWRWRRNRPKIGTRWPTCRHVAGRVEPDVAGDRPIGGETGRQPWCRGVQDAAPMELSEEPGRPARLRRDSQGRRRSGRLRVAGRRLTVRSRTLWYRAATHADSPPEASAPQTGGPASRQGAVAGAPRVAIAIPPSCCLILRCPHARGRVRRAVRHVRPLQRPACPTPTNVSRTSSSSSRRVVYDRTGKVELARFGVLSREVVGLRLHPRRDDRRHDRDRGQGLLDNPGFDTGGIVSAGLDTIAGRPRGASTITQQLVRARLLPAVGVRRAPPTNASCARSSSRSA